MADGHPHLLAQVTPVPELPGAVSDLAGALTRVQAYLSATQHRYVSEDSWWQGFARLFMELEAQSRNPIALEIAVDQLLARHGSTSWSIQRSRLLR
ncbi:hypothetical protein [Pseudoxanthomonas sp.]|uniref:hypothetical protein n=1 Tax=Pseudoxanthomonas sp. TaxID=1871049 RepID=UPI002638D7EA|nr:hypothetical protein [Pseudoxanthomonas sp.]WDS35360.1 MAG: hypothetical protein O8I58_13520 [Pseudoxanthomonas sp.]